MCLYAIFVYNMYNVDMYMSIQMLRSFVEAPSDDLEYAAACDGQDSVPIESCFVASVKAGLGVFACSNDGRSRVPLTFGQAARWRFKRG